MKTLIKRMTVMSVTLVLFCALVIAQNEKSFKTVTVDSYGVTLYPSGNIVLAQGDSIAVTIVPWEGYGHPSISFNNNTYGERVLITGENFTAVLNGHILTIRANNSGLTELYPEYMKVVVQMIGLEDKLKNRISHNGEASISITVVSRQKNIVEN